MKPADCKLQSLSDLCYGEATLTLIRRDNEASVVVMSDADLAFWEARIAAVRAKAKEK